MGVSEAAELVGHSETLRLNSTQPTTHLSTPLRQPRSDREVKHAGADEVELEVVEEPEDSSNQFDSHIGARFERGLQQLYGARPLPDDDDVRINMTTR